MTSHHCWMTPSKILLQKEVERFLFQFAFLRVPWLWWRWDPLQTKLVKSTKKSRNENLPSLLHKKTSISTNPLIGTNQASRKKNKACFWIFRVSGKGRVEGDTFWICTVVIPAVAVIAGACGCVGIGCCISSPRPWGGSKEWTCGELASEAAGS